MSSDRQRLEWQPPQRPRWIERLNAHAIAAGDARDLIPLDGEALLHTARAGCSLSDFGGGMWRKHFDILIKSLNEESDLHVAGRVITRSEILRSLRNRLQLTKLWQDQPNILEHPLPPAIFVLGSPRSGTSILFELLSCDPQSRAPLMWEMLHPAESLTGEDRRRVGDATTQFWHDVQPEYETMHANSGDLPNECIFITMNEFLSDAWGGSHLIPTYEAHLLAADHRPAFRFHQRVLKTLQQRQNGDRWLLKAPSHLAQLGALFDVYPDAHVIQTHRDPLRTVPSTLSLLGTLKWMRCNNIPMTKLAPLITAGQAGSYQRELSQRESGDLNDDRFVDVRYSDLMTDALGTIDSIYQRLGWTLTASTRGAMMEYLKRKPKNSRGRHRYSLAEFGLDADEERRRYAFYCDRFNIPAEED